MSVRSALPKPSIPDAWLYIAGRGLWSLIAVFIILNATFLLIWLIPDYSVEVVLFGMAYGGASVEELQEIEEQMLAAEPTFWEEYTDWMMTVLTFDFAHIGGEIVDYTVVTLLYLVPAAFVAFVLALGLGYLSAVHRNRLSDYLMRSSSYLIFAIPNFLAAALVMVYLQMDGTHWLIQHPPEPGYLEVGQLPYLILPFVFMTTHLFAIQLRYARAKSLEYLQETFVKVAKAKGAHPLRVMRHVLRSAAVPLFTLFVVEVIGVLLVTIFVIEAVLGVPGIGLYAYEAVISEAVMEILLVTMLFSIVILLADFAQDVAYAALDPRIGSEGAD